MLGPIFLALISFLGIRLVLTSLPQESQMNLTSATRSLFWRFFRDVFYFPALLAFSCAIKYSMYSFMVRFVSFAFFLMSSCSFSVTVMHL